MSAHATRKPGGLAIGLTGGVACGKSHVARALGALLEARVFCSDSAVHRLLDGDPEVRAAVADAFPQSVEAGAISRAALREAVFNNPDARRQLEAILHPAVRSLWMSELAQSRRDCAVFIAEIPLLFEVGVDAGFDLRVAVLCSRQTQVARLVAKRSLSREFAAKMIDAQLPAEVKAERADVVVWNDGSPAALTRQIRILAARVRPEQEIVA